MADEKRIALGPAGQAVSENLRRLRGEMTYAELSAKLEALGRPIPVLGLRRIEKGDRRVDLDDIIALARALAVPPPLLIYPLGQRSSVEVMPGVERPTWDAFKWFTARAAFPSATPSDGPPDPISGDRPDVDGFARVMHRVFFHEDHDRTVGRWFAEYHSSQIIADAAAAATTDQERKFHEVRLQEVRVRLNELVEDLRGTRQNMRVHEVAPPPLPPILVRTLGERTFEVYERIDRDGRILEQRVVDAGGPEDAEMCASSEWYWQDLPFHRRPPGYVVDHAKSPEVEGER